MCPEKARDASVPGRPFPGWYKYVDRHPERTDLVAQGNGGRQLFEHGKGMLQSLR